MLLATAIAAAAWLGCNAVLGIESATFDPTAAGNEGGTDGNGDAIDPDGRPIAPDGGPCVDVATNPKHCGRCGHDCLGGTCVDGRCQPMLLAIDDAGPRSIGVHGDFVYWTTQETADLKRMPSAGGAVTTLYNGPDGVGLGKKLGFTNGEVYFPGPGGDGVARCPVAGCPGNVLDVIVPNLSSCDYVSVQDENTVVFAESIVGGRVGRCQPPCAAPEIFAAAEDYPLRVWSDGAEMYWTTLMPGVGNVRRGTLGAPETIATGVFAYEIATSGNDLVYATLDRGPIVLQRDGGGAARRVLAGGSVQTEDFVLKDGQIYFTDIATNGRVFACPLAGCSDDGGAPLATMQARPRAIAVDDVSVFWINDTTGHILRVAK